MTWFVIAFIVTVALLAPLAGADTRDGRDWTPGERLRSLPRPARSPAGRRVRTTGSPARPFAALAPAVAARRVRAGG
ncbi:hypothetical protein Sru01_04000 [Sphaerisporangium rufum]|uniref:Uncharacterized protein n=1 Tax=Sphaerisporangium rufum TaxID=1381558 RepID=A0A919UZC4_9ACTN|nr:hypothetical protein Sru01_04000 [Sphaerisporangium rufum]